MKKVIILSVLGLYTLLMLRLSIVEASTFNNTKTKDNGIVFILNEHVYNAACKVLCVLNLDDNGAIGDIKIIGTKHTYIVFEL